MSSLREIKDRIGSVKSTLKITSAMKLVASSKLRKAQKAIETLRPYEETLCGILSSLTSGSASGSAAAETFPFDGGKKAVVVISSNSSLCGGFNGNVVKKALEVLKGCGDVDLFAIGKRGADALRKAGYPSDDWSELVAKPSYALSEKLAKKIAGRFSDGEYSQVILVYNHFVTTAHQEVVIEQYLPFAAPVAAVRRQSVQKILLYLYRKFRLLRKCSGAVPLCLS